MDIIRILIAVNLPEYRQELTEKFSEEEDLLIIGEAVNGANAVKKAEHLLPDIIIMDVNMPTMDGIAATEKITQAHPNIGVVLIDSEKNSDNIRRAMLAGAGDILYYNDIQEGDLEKAVRRLFGTKKAQSASYGSAKGEEKEQKYRPPQVVTIFGAKGGSGKTTLAVNVAVDLARETKRRVALLDFNFQFGDVAAYLNIQPRRTIAEFVQERNQWDVQLLNSYLIIHNSGIRVLASPLRPEDAELVTPEQVEKIIMILRQSFDFIVIDSPPYISDTLLTALDASNQIILLMSMELPAIKNVKLSLNLMDSLHHIGKTKLVINRVTKQFGVDVIDVEKTIDYIAAAEIPSEGNVVVNAANKGIPFVMSHPQTVVSKAVQRISQLIIQDNGYQNDLREEKDKGHSNKSIIRKIFG